LKAEINALQKRLNAPSEDAIGWRVAYEEAREALEKKLDEDGNDYAELEEKKSLLEETVDRLCGEKFELERKITELSESSNETRKEIESIMNEVDALEREMVNCQEQLNVKNDQCREFESRANDAESQLEKVKATNESASVERELLENQVSKLQASVSEYSQNMTKLTKTSEEKNKDLLEMESLVIEKEKELQYVIDELRKELKETNSTLSEKDGTIRDLEKRLCSASEENQNLSAQIKEAISEVNRQKIQIVAMEEKIKVLAEEKDSTVQSIEKENSRNIAEFTRKIESLEEKVVELSSEKDGLESKLSHMKQHVELSSGNLVENRADIESLESQLSEMSEVHAAAEKSMEAQSSELNGKFCSATERVEVLSAKIAVVEAERHTAVRNIEEERDLMASNLGHEIDGLQRNLAHSVEEKEVLRGKLSIIDTKEVELKSTIECLMDAVQNADASLQAVEEESKATMDTAVLETEERERRLTEHASELEIERDELLEEIYEMNEELRTIVEENMDLHGQIQFSDSQIESLKSDIVRAEEAQLESTHVFEDKLNRIVDECNHMTKLKNKFELELKEKQNEIARMLNESATQRRALDDAYSKVQESLNAQEKLRMSQHDASLADTGTIQTLTLAKEDLEAEILHCRKEIEELKSIEYSRKQEILGLQETANKFEGDTKDALSKLTRTEEGHESIENVHKSLLRKKDVKIGEIKSKFSSLENDCSTLRKQIELMTTSANEFEGKHNRLQDRFTLLQREKGNLEFELDTMQEDQNALSDQVRVLGDQNHELQSENERLQSVINDMKNGDNQSLKSDAISSSGSTWNSDSRLSYETLTTNMDNMLEDMLENISKKKEDTNITSPEEHMSAKNDLEGGDLDDSFDESMFLPNVEDQVAPQDAPADPPVNKRVDKESEKENKSIAILGDENIESNKTKSSLSFCATPSKVNDYGKRRVPLSDRKNRTPLSTQSKRLRLSSRKVITSSKKSRTNYMFIDNTQLFG
jgi:chromosome segregation ATPase